jgi:hypothetical protein
MKRLQLPKNKFLKLLINIILIFIWFIIWDTFHQEVLGWQNPILYGWLPFLTGSYITTRYVWFGRLRPKRKITGTKD